MSGRVCHMSLLQRLSGRAPVLSYDEGETRPGKETEISYLINIDNIAINMASVVNYY